MGVWLGSRIVLADIVGVAVDCVARGCRVLSFSSAGGADGWCVGAFFDLFEGCEQSLANDWSNRRFYDLFEGFKIFRAFKDGL